MEKGIWLEIEELYKEFQQLGISQSVDYEKYYLYSLITHSTAIEGSTLTEMDAQLLFDEGVTCLLYTSQVKRSVWRKLLLKSIS